MSLAKFPGCCPKHIPNGGQVPAPLPWPSGYRGRLAQQEHQLTGQQLVIALPEVREER